MSEPKRIWVTINPGGSIAGSTKQWEKMFASTPDPFLFISASALRELVEELQAQANDLRDVESAWDTAVAQGMEKAIDRFETLLNGN